MQQSVDLLILGGTIVTMDETGRILEDGGLAIKGDRIVAVDQSSQLEEQYQAARVIDAGRKVVMPGLVDTYEWIANVCSGIARLYDDGVLNGPILHLQDSWIGLYTVGDN